MELITLLTDYSHKDFYLAKVKTRLQKYYPKSSFLDICHNISKFSLKEASYNFNALTSEFNPECLHFIFVNLHYAKNNKLIVAQTLHHGLIVAPNNGILGLFKTEFKAFYLLDLPQKKPFLELSVIERLKNIDLKALQVIDTPLLLKQVTPRVSATALRGEVIYIDSYGNCITNITKETFEKFVDKSAYHIALRRNNIIERLSDDYSDNWEAGPAAFFNSQDYLEISSVHGNASALFGLKYESRIIVNKN